MFDFFAKKNLEILKKIALDRKETFLADENG